MSRRSRNRRPRKEAAASIRTVQGTAPSFTIMPGMRGISPIRQWANHMNQANGGLSSTAQINTGSTSNILSSAPGFYSPYHTPSAWQIPTNRKEVYAWCMHPGTLITMSDFTQKPISEIREGDEVITGSGTVGKVMGTSSKHYQGEMKRITTTNNVSPIMSTPEHQFYYADEEEFSCKYFKSSFRFCREKYVCSSKDCDDHNNIEERIKVSKIEAGELQEGDFLYSPTNAIHGSREDYSPGFMRFLGYYLAEGCMGYNREDALSRILLTLGESEKQDLVEDVRQIIKDEIDYDIIIRDRPSVMAVEINNKELAKQVLDLCGHLAHDKRIAKELFQQKPELLKELVIGYILGDGCRTKNGSTKITSVNYNLLSQIRFILYSLGIACRQANQEFNSEEDRKYHTLWLSCEDSNKLFHNSSHHNHKTIDTGKRKDNKQSFLTKDKIWNRIKSIENEYYEGKVYDFYVQDVNNCHQYLAEFCTVSNCSYWYENEPIVGSAIDFYSKFTMNGFTLDCDDSGVKEYFEELVNKLELQKWLVRISHEYFLYGDAFVFLELDCPRCQGTGYDQYTGESCDHCVSEDGEFSGAVWKSISVFDPNTVQVQEDAIVSKDPEISMIPSERMTEICTKGEPKEIFDSIPDNVKELIRSRRPIKLDNLSVTHLKFGGSPYQPYGTSLIRRLFPVLAYRDKLRQAQWIVAERHILPVKIVTLGSPERPASDDEITDAMEQLAVIANDPVQTIIAHDQFKLEWVGANGKVLQLTNEFDQIMQELQVGLQLNSALLQGEGPAYNSAQVGLEALAAKLKPIRDEFKAWIEQKIFKPIARFNNFYQDDARGNTKSLIYPKVIWTDLPLKDRAQELQILLQLRQRNEVSLDTIHTKIGLDYDDEIEKLRMEDTGAALSSPDMGLGISEGGDLGGGPVGGMGGGMPAEGSDLGAPPGAEGGAPPGGEMGAPPGVEGGGPPLAADVMMKNYRLAKSGSDMIKTSMIESHDYNPVLKRGPVLGTGYRGDLPEDPDIETNPAYLPWGPSITYAQLFTRRGEQLRHMMRIAGKEEDQVFTRKTYFTKPEQVLYKAVLSMNVGLPFFAQYIVGGNPNLRVDGAFPTIKLAVEADGETWHRSPDSQEKDRRRDTSLLQQGWMILRFTDKEIEEKADQVIEVIRKAIDNRLSKG